MVDDLLDVSKLESGLLGAWRRNVRMEDIMTQAESLLQQRAQVKNVELVVEFESAMPEVYCDADKVGRVITNLAVNAIKFAGDQGKVRLWAESDPAGQQVIVGVKDNGPGIERNSLERIFRRFQQLDNHLQSTVKGFGLGLNIAQQLCTLNLGELSVQSQLGKGSTFSFTIPFAYPIEILRRWLGVHGRIVSGLHAIEVNVGEEVSVAAADEFDSFLNCLLRQEDLLFRITPRTWMLVVVISSSKSRKWFRRAKKEFERTNRNRPLGPLPGFHAKVRCEWSCQDTRHSILQQFEGVIQKTTETCPIA